ncbi:hypothetical protein JJB09_03685 [Rhizobium sp. KVB221]|uniref:PilZ domain-containing protein n=1 Tax=Rhizobium setariae TaxID=2801340 RepID=A0A937CL21_9HYPH|nr:hypothetical protein [Rhizobium setariae]MBL0371121.1 hypothetical protein [Rhizobium setariae]
MNLKNFKDFNERLFLQNPKRSFKQHQVDRPGMIIPVGHHLTIKVQYNCLIESISCGGALLNFSPFIELPKNFFLVILGSSEEIGATVFNRDGDHIMAKFNMFLDAGFLQSIVGTASIEIEPL